MKLTVHIQLTLDGVAQANGGNNDVIDPGFTRGGWALPLGDEEGTRYILDAWRRPDAFLLGRKTYDAFAPYWGAQVGDGGFGDAISLTPKYVVSNTLTDPDWQMTSVITGDVAGEIAALKEREAGELLVVGSAALARWLLAEGLVDELDIVQFPVIVGEGTRFFPAQGPDYALDLLAHRVFPTGVVAHTYRVGGRPRYA
jgi:dihydrofolate reductase